ncbi:MAG: hypothetical protein GY725_20160 [bacterium]|nr:hypothetical protein [bacterium]
MAATPMHPFPQHEQYALGTLRPNHVAQSALDSDVRNLYDAWKTRYLDQNGTEGDGHPRYRVTVDRDPNANTVSEGQGFGMLIAVLMAGHDPAAQTIFDGLWEFALDHRSSIDSRLMDWKVAADEIPDALGNDSAFDGDADMAYALLLAERQWGNTGRFHYDNEAASVMDGILASTIGPTTRLPLLGDWVDPGGAIYSEHTPRSSDFMTEHFRAFGNASGLPVWGDVVTAVQNAVDAMQSSHAPVTGLLPDFMEPVSGVDPTLRPADPGFLEGPNDGFYYFNALRDPLRLGIDALLTGDARSTTQVQKMSLWIAGAAAGDPAKILAGYELDGTPLAGSGYFTSAFAAPSAVAAMTEPTQQAWLNDLYDSVRLSDENYYEDTISLLAMLVLSGNYWSPSTPPRPIPALGMPAVSALMALLMVAGAVGLSRS